MYDSKSIIEYIRSAKKRTPAKAYIGLKSEAHLSAEGKKTDARSALAARLSETCRVFDCGSTLIVFGELEDIESAVLSTEHISDIESAEEYNAESIIEHIEIEITARNSAIPLLDTAHIDARIEPGAIIRDNVKIGKHAVIMMGAVINIGAEIGARTMIDMGAVLGGRAIVGADCHIGAGCVIAGVIEPESAKPAIIEDGVFIGANAVVIEGCRIGEKSVIGAGAVVTGDIPPRSLVVGMPGRVIKTLASGESSAGEIIKELREI